MSITTRFAPSPTGLLHLGHAFAALFAWRRAREAGGRFLLRLEDLDPERCRPEFAAAIEEDLAWLGLDWDGPAREQSAHMADYAASLARLDAMGLLYPCFCTRADIQRAAAHAPHGRDGGTLYPGTCRRLSDRDRAARLARGDPHALRLDMEAALARVPGPLTYEDEGRGVILCDPAAFGDAILARKDVPASYMLSVTHDDAVQGVTLVTRAEDLRPATDLQRLLQELLGWPAPRYAHHPLLLGPDGKRLSKRNGAPSLWAMREAGVTPAAVWERAGL
ncbi:MAG: tRNA glutamyl-Q(34) synthetase GluQRS [Acetobacteraceae bacterium]|nr:tRNA glutamyl-Q(34) synthetase GluQRS [Acetobacteraceae bacterium]